MSFTLDDVRESFTNDITRFLTEIEKGSKAIASATALAPADRTWLPPINAMVVGLHGIVGSSSLVGVDTMASTARRLEDIATLASESVNALRAHIARLKKIAGTCLEGSSDLRVMLEHELAGRKTESGIRKNALDKKLDVAIKEIADTLEQMSAPQLVEGERSGSVSIPIPKMPPLPKAPPVKVVAPKEDDDDGWDDTQVSAAPPVPPRKPAVVEAKKPPVVEAPKQAPAPTPPAMTIDAELLEVFQGEAREALTNLRGYLARLEQNSADREAATHCARLFHLLKGAAASVGLDEIANQAKDLHADVERLRASSFDPASLKKLRERSEQFIAFSVPDLAQGAGAAPAVDEKQALDDDEPRVIFREEAASSLEEARALLQQIRQTAGTARGVLTTRLERILHRLKGSALIVGEAQAAAVASRGQALCEALDRVDPDALSSVLEQIKGMVTTQAPRGSTKGMSLVRINLPPQGEWDVYLEESTGLLEELEQTLTKLERSQRPTVEVSNLFRSYHTLKGATNAVGLTPLGQQLHIIETFLERMVASPTVPDARGVVRALSEINEGIKKNIKRAGSDGEIAVDHDRTQQQLSKLGIERGSQGGGQGSKVTGASWIEPNDSAWSATADKGSSHHDSSRASEAEASEVPEVVSIEHAGGDAGDRRFVRVAADRLDSLLDLAGELVVCRSRMLSRVGNLQRLQEDDVSRHGAVTSLIDTFAQSTQFTNLDGRIRRTGSLLHSDGSFAASNAVDPGFGSLELDQYEEIHVLSRRLDEAASDINEVRRDMGTEMTLLTEDAEMLSTIATGLQSEITRARMLMVDTLFSRLRPPIRDAAHRTNREVELVTTGDQLAIDKSMSDALYGPLLHMVRNAVAHGVETPERREQLGKPRVGRISMSAKQEHGEIVLEVADDGAGINLEKLRQIGIEKKLIPSDVAVDDARVVDLIFARGISTAEGADDVAGRGVGGNVVKRAIDRLNGSIQITTKRGVGTTFRITLPLSMSITQAVLARVGGILLAIPIAYAETIVARGAVEIVDSFGRLRVRMNERMIPVHQMAKIFDPTMFKTNPSGAVMIVCVVGGERVVIEVDDIVSQEEIVVKSLGMLLEGHPLFSGSTSRGDGELALIIDVPGVLEAETIGGRGGARREPVARGSQPVMDLPDVESEHESHHSEHHSVAEVVPVAEPEDVLGIIDTSVPVPTQTRIEVSEVVRVPVGRLRVLFVDDSLSVRKVAERMLTGLDVDVVTAVDGQDALEKLRSMAFSLVFTDLEMPRMHGYELIREMQILPAYQSIPVVVISSRSGQKHIDQAITMGAKEYLTKPFSPEILNAVLGRLAKK
ncbi:MAG TPA: Hpt domain-containing protein [Kofleriaceae bacterium]|jgi:chemosensory pili system protein ChpA (sensor histidine kinase/response regulator)